MSRREFSEHPLDILWTSSGRLLILGVGTWYSTCKTAPLLVFSLTWQFSTAHLSFLYHLITILHLPVLPNEFCCNFNYFLWESPTAYYYIVIYYYSNYNCSFELLFTIILNNELCQVNIPYLKCTWKWLSFWRLSWWWVPLFLVFFCPTEI